jgi:hypothetical protein
MQKTAAIAVLATSNTGYIRCAAKKPERRLVAAWRRSRRVSGISGRDAGV